MTAGGAGDRRLAALQTVTDAALAHLNVDDLLRELLERLVAVLEVDTAAILLLDEERGELVARAARGLEEEVERGVRIPLGRGFAGRVAAEQRAVVIEDLETADIVNPLLREKGIQALLGVPLVVAGRTTGVLHVGTFEPREFTDDDASILQLVADRAALAIEHASAFEAEHAAREAAERAVAQLGAIQQIADAALAAHTPEELLAELLERVAELLSADTVAVLLLDHDREELVAYAARGLEEQVDRGVRIPLGRGFAGRVAAERRAIVIDDVDHAEILNPVLREKNVRSLMGVPLIVEGRVTGVLHVGSLVPREFTDEETELLGLVADRAGMAIERARLYEREHRIAETLQRSLLPDRLPELPATELAVRYVAPAAATDVGGDWYDAFPLRDGMIGLAIGDVVGRGLGAAALMGQLRNALRAFALDARDPKDVLHGLNQLARDLEPGRTATALYAVHDPDCGRLTVASAGHPAPLVVRPGERAALAELPASTPLGAMRAPVYEQRELELPPGSALVLYTDGLVESAELALDEGLARLCEAAATLPAGAEAAADHLLGRLLREGPRDDDSALLVFRPLPLGDVLETEFPAEPDSVPAMRRLLSRWLRDAGASDEAAYDVKVCTSEAVANAIEHAYGPGDEAVVWIRGSSEDGRLCIEVCDRGSWRAARGTNRGRGLALMEALMDSFEIEQGDAGTRVVLRRRAT